MTRVQLALLIAAPFVAFYIPGLMLLLGGFALGFSLHECREFVPVFGMPFGIAAFGIAAFGAAEMASYSIWENRK